MTRTMMLTLLHCPTWFEACFLLTTHMWSADHTHPYHLGARYTYRLSGTTPELLILNLPFIKFLFDLYAHYSTRNSALHIFTQWISTHPMRYILLFAPVLKMKTLRHRGYKVTQLWSGRAVIWSHSIRLGHLCLESPCNTIFQWELNFAKSSYI